MNPVPRGAPRTRRLTNTDDEVTVMPTPTTVPTDRGGTRAAPVPTPAPLHRQVRALAAAEWRQLRRNKVAVLNCGLPVAMGLMFASIAPSGIPLGALVTAMVIGTALLFVVYYTLVTAIVARRESLLLKRLRSGEAPDSAIVVGLALPFGLIALAQAAGVVVAAAFLFDDVQPGPGLILVAAATVLGVGAFTALAYASTGFTKTVEHAQITTLPVILVPLLLSGLVVPLAILPDGVRVVAELLPLTPIVELTQLGLTGQDADGQALTTADTLIASIRPLLVLLGWTLVAAWLGTRRMRWEPRS